MYDALPNEFWNFCFLPEQPEGGRYELDGCTKPCDKNPNDRVPRNSILIYSCGNNYVLSGNAISVCFNLTWSSLSSCLKICPPLRSTSVDISCSRNGETVSCNKFILPGTQATFTCKPSYKLPITTDPGYREITCLDDGTWDNYIFRCLPECGTSIARGKPLIVNGYETKVGIFPWHVGIYAKLQSDKYEQICGGTLISNNLVISAAHCFYDEVFNKISNASNYAVGAGKYFRDWNATDESAQKSLVESIRSGERYIGRRGNFADDIALVKLQTSFQLTTLVRPVCMDWDNQYEREQLNVQQSGKIVGWGKDINGESTKNLHEIDMPFVPYHQCRSEVPRDFEGYITTDKFCAGHLNGSSVCDGDSGGGICFEKNGIWYLRGVVSVSPVRNGNCDYNSYVAFTSVSNSRHWIRQAYANALREVVRQEALQTVSFNRTNTHVENTNENRSSNSRDCILPEQPEGGHYELISCAEPCSKLPNDLVPEFSVLSYTCKHNYILSRNTVSICINQKWTTPPSCLKICSPLRSTSVDISCSYQDETVSCTKNVLPGTKATLACKPFYTLSLTGDSAYREIICLDDGLWDNDIIPCIAECGKNYADSNAPNKVHTKLEVFPWHVGIYFKRNTSEYELRCGGTLIKSNLVISAAHCFYEVQHPDKVIETNYAVGAGKYYHDWDAKEDEDYVQKSSVENILMSEKSIDFSGNFIDKIALLKLKKPFQLTILVRPVCMDWSNQYEREQLQEGQAGKIVNWRRNIHGKFTNKSQEFNMLYVPYQQCLSALPRDVHNRLTADRFCARRLNGSNVCEEEGSGLCFKTNGIWYLRGIASVHFWSYYAVRDCNLHFLYFGFYYVSGIRDWIREIYINDDEYPANTEYNSDITWEWS
ncbi:Modular serine protease [Formica fusca]